jgi:heme exporter protein B
MPMPSNSPVLEADPLPAAPATPAAWPTDTAASRPAERWRQYWRAVGALLWKDLAAELRSKELISSMLVFAVLMILIFNFALLLDRTARESVAAGVLWVTTVFTGTLGLNRSLAQEKDRGSLDGLLLAPIDRSVLYFGKALGNLIFILLVQVIMLPVFTVLFDVSMLQPMLLLVVLLGSIGYCAVGTLLASLAVHSRSRDVMLPILLFPVAVPILIAAVRASSGVLSAADWADISPWINLLLVYDVIFTAVAFMVFEYVVEE